MSVGGVLRLNASDNEFDHPVTQGEMDAGGFEWNVTIECELAYLRYVDGILGVAMNDVWNGPETGMTET